MRRTFLFFIFLFLVLSASKFYALDKADIFQKAFGKAPPSLPQNYQVSVFLDGHRLIDQEITYLPFEQDVVLPVEIWLPLFAEDFKPEKLSLITALKDSQNNLHKLSLETLGFIVSFDASRLVLTITSPYSFRKKVKFSILGNNTFYSDNLSLSTLSLIPQAKLSGYLNFDFHSSFTNYYGASTDTTLLSWAANVNANGWIGQLEGAFSSVSYLSGARLVHDDLDRKQRVFLGSFTPSLYYGNPLSNQIFGVGIRRVWNDQPNYDPFDHFSRNIVLAKSGMLQLSLNDQVVFHQVLPAGEYSFSDFGDAFGLNRLNVQFYQNGVTENMGTSEFYFDQRIVAPKVVEYGLSTGFPYSSVLNVQNFDTTTPLAIGFARIGLDNNLNLGSSLQVEHDYSIWGVQVQKATFIGLSEARLNSSFGPSHSGFLSSFGLSGYLIKGAPFPWLQSYGVNVSYFSPEYAENAQFQIPPISYQISPTVVWYINGISSVQLQLDMTEFRNSTFFTGYNLTSTNYLGDWTIQTSLRYGLGDVDPRFEVGFAWTEIHAGNRTELAYNSQPFTSIRYSLLGTGVNSLQQYLTSQYTSAHEYQLGYTANFNHSFASFSDAVLGSDRTDSLALYAEGQRGIFQFNYLTSQLTGSQGGFDLSSALVYADGHSALSKPINDSFLIVYPSKKLKGYLVEFDNEYSMDETGPAVISRLSSYRLNRITVTRAKTPLGMDLGRQSSYIVPGYASGAALEIGSSGDLLVMGSLVSADTREPLALVYAQLRSVTNPREVPKLFFTNKNGQFVFVGLSLGQYEIKLANAEHDPIYFSVEGDESSIVRIAPIAVKLKMQTKEGL